MNHFPVYLNVENQKIVVCGGGETALAKLRLLRKTSADIHVYHPNPVDDLIALAQANVITLHHRHVLADDISGAALFYAAHDNDALDREQAALAAKLGVLSNVVDNLAASAFITPAIVDRDPVTIAIGTEGTAPILARQIKAHLEEQLDPNLGVLAQVAKPFRAIADQIPMGPARRKFWGEYYRTIGPRALTLGKEAVQSALEQLFKRHQNPVDAVGHVAFVGAGPGDPELLTLKARKELDRADVVIYDRLVGTGILELARREARMIDVGKTGFGPSVDQDTINKLIVTHAQRGDYVVRLKGGDCTVFGRLDEEIESLAPHDIGWHIVPGITAASASAAAIGQSLTKRGRNTSVRFLTGHDMAGFADHDWTSLAGRDQVAAIYMGKKSSRFIQGRMLMHGARADTPVSIIENASRADQTITSVTLDRLAHMFQSGAIAGPALIFLGLQPRDAASLPLTQKETA
jgi:uroporphyrin-III C-methyltransferase/precorrin-2 dehydrogenase/sirohydrochlorin ferrochelatase